MEDLRLSERSVWAVTRPLQNPAPHLNSSPFAFAPLWALLISELSKDDLQKSLEGPPKPGEDLGCIWEVDNSNANGVTELEAVQIQKISLEARDKIPLCLKYCGTTKMHDGTILDKGKLSVGVC